MKFSIKEWTPGQGLLVVIIVAFLVRIGLLLAVQPWDGHHYSTLFLKSDAGSYFKLATTLYRFGEYSLSDATPYYPDSFITPAYPGFLFLIFGITGKSLTVALLVQIVMSISTCVLVYNLVLKLFGTLTPGKGAALTAGLIMALEPICALYSVITVTETLFLFLFVNGLYFFLMGLYEKDMKKSIGRIALSGAFFGLALLTRPVIQFYIALPVISLLVMLPGWKRKTLTALTFVAVTIAMITPWLMRNYRVFGEAGLSTVGSYNMLFGNAAFMEAKRTGKSIDQITEEYKAKYLGGKGKGTIDFKTAAIAQKIGMQIILDDPLEYAKLHMLGSMMFMVVPGSTVYCDALGWGQKQEVDVQTHVYGSGLFEGIRKILASKSTFELIYIAIYSLFLLALYIAATLGSWRLIRLRKKYFLGSFLVLSLLYFPLITGPVGDTARYRIPIMPFVAILASLYVTRNLRAEHSESMTV